MNLLPELCQTSEARKYSRMILAVYMIQNEGFLTIGDSLRILVPFVQFKKYEKHPWRSVTVSKVAG